MLKLRKLIRLMLVVLLLAAMIVPLAGAVGSGVTISGVAAPDGPAAQAGTVGEQPAAVIACQTGDPGTSGGGCGGG